ncbi:type I glyceraldehyde-3-phosphate dehydrogenase [Spiribacter insolitus]|uniref:Glyceraldehyde 3-phosphate dehydrogenase NAD-binding domain-containing protein n=1 Tax=Spiribacter insolitus TaxID=3122417 RepID=A0ABV3T625_9GAMM
MAFRIAINGFGRIGRSVLRAMQQRQDATGLEIAAINEPADPESIALLTRYDSNHGTLSENVTLIPEGIRVGEQRIKLLPGVDAADAPWAAYDIDVVMDCSGQPGTRALAEAHLSAGAGRVIYSQPASADVDMTVIPGFNHHKLQAEHRILSAGSCTSNCIIPVLDVLGSAFGIRRGTVTTIHSAMNDQPISDTLSGDRLRLNRAALNAVTPVNTALDRGIARLMPEMDGRFECLHLRVPTSMVSALDLTLELDCGARPAEVLGCLNDAANGQYRGILGACPDPVSSLDFAHDPRSVIVDLTQLRVIDNQLIKLVCWFDNEWAFANRMIDIALRTAGFPSLEQRRGPMTAVH